jgi:hypothetical protein
MSATPPRGSRHEVFQNALLRAVTEGQTPSRTGHLGYETRSIIEAIAERHPEANPDLIGDAYDAFNRESDGGRRASGAPPNC